MASLTDIVRYLDSTLDVREVPDSARAVNGLQLETGTDEVVRVAAAVDACQAAIDGAVAANADLLLVHHGLFWNGLEPLTGRHGRRVRAALAGGLSIYGAHIPLDLHPRFGNNAVLARDLHLTAVQPFGMHEGVAIGCAGQLDMPREELAQRLESLVGARPHVVATGPERVRRVGIVTGAGSSALGEAADRGLDTLITGEAPHHAYFDAEEAGLNLILGGHYATETVGVKALAAHLAERFGVEWVFIDHPTGL